MRPIGIWLTSLVLSMLFSSSTLAYQSDAMKGQLLAYQSIPSPYYPQPTESSAYYQVILKANKEAAISLDLTLNNSGTADRNTVDLTLPGDSQLSRAIQVIDNNCQSYGVKGPPCVEPLSVRPTIIQQTQYQNLTPTTSKTSDGLTVHLQLASPTSPASPTHLLLAYTATSYVTGSNNRFHFAVPTAKPPDDPIDFAQLSLYLQEERLIFADANRSIISKPTPVIERALTFPSDTASFQSFIGDVRSEGEVTKRVRSLGKNETFTATGIYGSPLAVNGISLLLIGLLTIGLFGLVIIKERKHV